ncbi:MAG: hypothetical protein ACTSWW_10730 [Promethearchaeota archaeon]
MEIIHDMINTLELILDELYFNEISDNNALLFLTTSDYNLLALQAQLHDLLHEIRQHTHQDASVQMIADAFQALFEKTPRRKKRKKANP